MRKPKFILFAVVLLISMFLGQQIISLSMANQVRKQDYSEINNIKYGLFSINQWKEQLSNIINSEITELDVRGSEKKLKPLLEAQLNQLIDGVDQKMREKNKKTFKGKFKQAFVNTFVDMKDIKEGIPQYADAIIKLMEKPKSKKNLKGILLDKVEEYFDKTFEKQDMTQVNLIMQKMGTTDLGSTKVKIDQEIAEAQKHIFLLTWILLGLATFIFVVAGFSKDNLPSGQYIVLVAILFVLLICGVMTPMIDLEAKISEMSFVLFDHPVKFLNQILYFQTKSVLDVFWIMITHADIQMKAVGILMVLFSVVFPILKLLSSVGYYYNHWNARKNKWVQFFVLKSGKWSMTDVMIIAIFMAYIGFNGIISSQFGKLHSGEEEIVLLTTNGTSLQPGFYLFLGYTILALFLSEFLTKTQPASEVTKTT
ncbi:MAG: paraquat-inducible protein A [Bdellovibrio sp.]|nr:paraquat-inducible protein A [Bdellovibrio sp.]